MIPAKPPIPELSKTLDSKIISMRLALAMLHAYLTEIPAGILSPDDEGTRVVVIREVESNATMSQIIPVYAKKTEVDSLRAAIQKCFRVIDTIPVNAVLPAMSGIDRDWAESLLDDRSDTEVA